MSRLVKKSPSVCTDLPLDNADICNKLRLMRELLGSCYGPTGRLKQIHNNIGGRVVTTSSSSVLLPAIASSEPFVNLIRTSILHHVRRFGDCGLFAAIFCLSLVEQAKQSGLRAKAVIRSNEHLASLCTDYLKQGGCGCKVKLDLCSGRDLVALARSVVSSKPACVLTEPECVHISRLAVRAFLLTVPCDTPGSVSLGQTVRVSVEGLPVTHSAVVPGLLVDTAEDVYLSQPCSLPHPLVLFSASLAGDLSELGDGLIEVHPRVDSDSQVLSQLLELGNQVVRDGVKVFVCQKVIHPVLQLYLTSHGVTVVERLGVTLMEPLIQLTGAQPVATLHSAVQPTAYGQVGGLSVRRFGSKTMLHLQACGESAICTIILCHRNETMLNELKVTCQKAEHVLRLALREPSALRGGGCTETHLAAYSKSEVPALGRGCSQTEYLRAAEAFCRSLESVARSLEHDGGTSTIDPTHAHRWTRPSDVATERRGVGAGCCGCGSLDGRETWTSAEFPPADLLRDASVQPGVLDSFTAKLNALQVAVETANLALDVRYVIRDVN
ncbi:McKusick-Kaufman/Bardet-Biedl syndromes putative chaperonin isoform X2 [Kryptolebias marmoratus]|uniref:McKusick-Kaufman/Bardet-Biedl syndromes putative chaperonin isoform X2 n=1 Tax=Kryptolebias marmoratus TaxID=37003 RepID=UPI0007F8AAA9|nr:McKusick-Kaufman/Bardet-Biedl syndromes putative chaperonin isoform X2 [Kryptolebias marmoratus]